MLLLYGLTLILGLVLGSFANVLIWRLPRKMGLGGRSICPQCLKKIRWYDNIPLISFFVLKGRCRDCQKQISWRYPLVEVSVALASTLLVFVSTRCFSLNLINQAPICDWMGALWTLSYFYYLFIAVIFVSVFVVDLRDKIILDQLSFWGFGLSVFFLIFFRGPDFFENIFAGLVAALFLLLIHLVTRGRGMGLGDVKFALFAGTLLGWPETLTWLFLSFLTGAAIGSILIMVKKANLKTQIAFGPFLVAAAFVAFIFGHWLVNIFFKW